MVANDEFFADRENLLLSHRPGFRPNTVDNKGQVMDGWETRRRRGTDGWHPHPSADDHDWALIRLGLPGTIHGVVVDTAHFRANYPREVSIEAVALPGQPGAEELLDKSAEWQQLVPRSLVRGHAANGFAVADRSRYTHLRLKQFPDGGIARLRVHGRVCPDPAWLAALGTFDLAALECGGMIEDASEGFYGPPVRLLWPGKPRALGEGWETGRRRDGGHDWVRIRLAGRGEIRAVEIDTSCQVGNAVGWAALYGHDETAGGDEWFALLDRTRLQPDAVHRLLIDVPRPATHVRLDIFPDGGIARLRLNGNLCKPG